MIRYSCPKCGVNLKSADDKAGARTACPRCGEHVSVPGSQPAGGRGNEGQEPAHIHVRTPEGECKFWLAPAIRLARNRGVRPHDLRRIEQLVFEHHDVLRKAFDEHHNR